MRPAIETKACEACARSKRKCTREAPTCNRCASRGLACVYAPTKGHANHFSVADQASHAQSPLPRQRHATGDGGFDGDAWPTALGLASSDSSLSPVTAEEPPPINLTDASDAADKPRSLPERCSWFLRADTWNLIHLKPYQIKTITRQKEALADRSVAAIKDWVLEWLPRGSSPYVHFTLYDGRMPTCVADAYSTIALYRARTPRNKSMINRIIHERMVRLVSAGPGPDNNNNSSSSSSSGPEAATIPPRRPPSPPPVPDYIPNAVWPGTCEPANDNMFAEGREVLQRLARVHALLAYLVLGLLDGDICLRRHAEHVMPVMQAWLDALLAAARAAAQHPLLPILGYDSSTPALQGLNNALGYGAGGGGGGGGLDASSTAAVEEDELLWRTWAVTESVRRTWTVAGLAQSIYGLVYTGVHGCQPRLTFTARAAAWDAPSSFAWRQSLPRPSGGELLDVRDVLSRTRPGEVDEFCRLVAETTFGLEAMERWGVDVHESA